MYLNVINDKFSKIYQQLIWELVNSPRFITKPRGFEIKELLNTTFCITNPLNSLYINKYRSSPIEYIKDELAWYISRDRSVEWIGKKAGLWKQIAENGLVNSNYGNLIFEKDNDCKEFFTQFEWVIESLYNDIDSRQAFMHFNRPKHQYFENKDQVCTMYAIFHIRENLLHMTVHMRSSDVIFGLSSDVPIFCLIQQQVLKSLQLKYPHLKLGTYYHISNSLHLYERHYEIAENMSMENFESNSLNLVNSFIEDDLKTVNKIGNDYIFSMFDGARNFENLIKIGE